MLGYQLYRCALLLASIDCVGSQERSKRSTVAYIFRYDSVYSFHLRPRLLFNQASTARPNDTIYTILTSVCTL